MKILDELVEQCKEPKGLLGIAMIRIMNIMDVGLTKWALGQINYTQRKILDIGCGGGKTVHMLSKRYPKAKIYGIDYSGAAVKTTIKKNKQKVNEGNIIISQASVSSIPFPDDFFNCITAIRTHYFWPDLMQDMKEVFRVLNKDGQFLILAEVYKINYHMKQYNTNASLKQLLKDTGFKSVEISEKNQCICVITQK
jgi:ubiquinone/menaquinone biosynthesis C-methylase UbiE